MNLDALDVCLLSNNNYCDTNCTLLFNTCVFMHIYDIPTNYCICLCWVIPWRWPKNAKHVGLPHVCIILYLIIVQLLEYILWCSDMLYYTRWKTSLITAYMSQYRNTDCILWKRTARRDMFCGPQTPPCTKGKRWTFTISVHAILLDTTATQISCQARHQSE